MYVHLSLLERGRLKVEWDEEKNRENFRKHDVRFETAELVFEDPYALTQRDILNDSGEERWVSLGSVLGLIGIPPVLFVVYTWRDEATIRIISARAATSRERKAYEETHRRAEAGHRSRGGKKGRRD